MTLHIKGLLNCRYWTPIAHMKNVTESVQIIHNVHDYTHHGDYVVLCFVL